jgi:hypothetical protein
MSIADALNTRRPADDQIPLFLALWEDFRKHLSLVEEYGIFGHRKMLRDFRAQFPHNSAYFWYIGGLIWLTLFFIGSASLVMWH